MLAAEGVRAHHVVRASVGTRAMTRKFTIPAIAVAATASFALAPSAGAQATRTWVTGVGDDVNPCSRTAPCKTFAGAISKTAAGGEINCLDPAGFGAVTITKSMTISCPYTEGGVLAGGNGIVVNAGPGDVVYLRGLDIFGVAPPSNGIRFVAGGALHLDEVRIRNFNAANSFGISFVPSATSRLYIVNSRISDNGNIGANGGGTGGGINVDPGAAGKATVFIIGTVISNNAGSAILASDLSTNILVSGSAIVGNGVGLFAQNQASINSSGDNVLSGNATNGTFKAVIPKN
jgi:hypothetical protein